MALPGGASVEYVIDGLDRRIGRKENGVLTRQYLYKDGLKPVAELDGNGELVALYAYAEWSHAPSLMLKGGKSYRIVSDHLGSPRRVIDSDSGAIVQALDYDEWGNVLADSNPGFQPFGFAGGLYDPATKLLRFGARDYDPSTGRWTAKDPIMFNGGDTNLYAYVGNNPLSYTDPYGLSKFDPFYGLPKKFWNWLHAEDGGKLIKDLKDGTGNVPPDIAKDYHKEWENLGKPNQRNEKGFADPELLEWLFPWWLTPSELGADPCEMPGGPACAPPPSCP